MSDINADDFKAMIKEQLGTVRAEMAESAAAFTKSLEERFGSVDTAKALGQNVSFHDRENVADDGGAVSPYEKARRERLYTDKNAFGRMVRGLTRLKVQEGIQGRKAYELLAANAKASGDESMANALERSFGAVEKVNALSDFSGGGALVPEEFVSSVIPLLYAQVVVNELGATHLPMPNGNLTLPFGKTGVSGSYVGEVESISNENPSVGTFSMVAKKLATIVDVANDLLRTPSAGADRWIQDTIIQGLARTADLQFLRGVGSESSPKGARQFILDSGDAALVFNTAGTTLANKVSDLGQMIRVVEENDIPFSNPGFAFDKRTEWGLKTTLSTDGQFVFKAEMDAGSLMGYRYKSTTAMPNNLSTGSVLAEILFYNWGHFIIGDTDDMEIVVAPNATYKDGGVLRSGLSDDITPVRAIVRHDTGSRYRGLEGSLMQDVAYA